MRNFPLVLLLAASLAATAEARPIYLTFDDGPSRYTPDVLRVLERFDAPATFFMCGKQAQKRPGLAARVARHGHRIGNHSWSHPHFWDLDYRDELRQLSRTQRLLERLTGRTPTLMRAPFVQSDADTDRANARLGLALVGYDVSPRDWEWRAGVTADQIVERTLDRIDAGGSVVLLHDAECRYPHLTFPEETIAALPRIIRGIRARGHALRRWPERRAFRVVADDPRAPCEECIR